MTHQKPYTIIDSTARDFTRFPIGSHVTLCEDLLAQHELFNGSIYAMELDGIDGKEWQALVCRRNHGTGEVTFSVAFETGLRVWHFKDVNVIGRVIDVHSKEPQLAP